MIAIKRKENQDCVISLSDHHQSFYRLPWGKQSKWPDTQNVGNSLDQRWHLQFIWDHGAAETESRRHTITVFCPFQANGKKYGQQEEVQATEQRWCHLLKTSLESSQTKDRFQLVFLRIRCPSFPHTFLRECETPQKWPLHDPTADSSRISSFLERSGTPTATRP